MAKPSKLCIDCDGVLADFGGAFRSHMNVLYPELKLTTDPTMWSWADLGCTDEMVGVGWKHWRQINDVWAKLAPLPDAGVLHNAIQEGLLIDSEIWFVTSRAKGAGRSILEQTKEWLFWNVGVDHANVIVVEHSSSKADVVRALGMTHSVDDYAPTIISLNHQRGHKAYLMRKPWNEYEMKAYELPWVASMREFVEEVLK